MYDRKINYFYNTITIQYLILIPKLKLKHNSQQELYQSLYINNSTEGITLTINDTK